jgi:hypothetical protein
VRCFLVLPVLEFRKFQAINYNYQGFRLSAEGGFDVSVLAAVFLSLAADQ